MNEFKSLADGSTRLVFHCYDEEVPLFDASLLGKHVMNYTRQSQRAQVARHVKQNRRGVHQD